MTIKGYGTLFGVGYKTITHDGIGLLLLKRGILMSIL
jgi:hypothetical protein